MSTETLVRPSDPELDTGDPTEAHYVDKRKITEAYVEGTPLIALCGKVFVPSRDPKNLPVCPQCTEIAEGLWGKDHEDIQ